MAKEITKPNAVPKEYISPSGVPIGTESISGEDILLPRIRIIQPTSLDSQDGVGKLKNSVTGEIHEKVDLIPLMMRRGWICFPEGQTHSAPESICFSPPLENDESLAAECWRLGSWYEARIKYPTCSDVREFPCLSSDGKLSAVSFKGTGIREAKKLITQVKFRGTPFFFYTVELTTEKAEGQKGIYYIPQLKITDETNTGIRKQCLEAVKFLRTRRIQVDYGPNGDSLDEL